MKFRLIKTLLFITLALSLLTIRFTQRGRVLNFVSISDDLKKSRDTVIHQIEKLNWKNGFYRKDIGFRVIDK